MADIDENILVDTKKMSLNENKPSITKVNNGMTKCFKTLTNGSHRNSNNQRFQNNRHYKPTFTNGTSNGHNSESTSGHQHAQVKNKKIKRLPWNAKVLEDRFTPQTYLVQLIDFCLRNLTNKNEDSNFNLINNNNVLVFLRDEEYKNYLKIMVIKQYSLYLNRERIIEENVKSKKLILLITNMGSEVSRYVEIISRHTTLKLAGIDLNVMSSSNSDAELNKLKREANILIMSVNVLVEWFKKGFLIINEIELIIFDEVSAAFHNNSYKTFMETFYSNQESKNNPKIFGLGSLDIDRSTTHSQVKHHIEHLKDLFKTVCVETATDLLDTQNLIYGFEPHEYILVCENACLLNQQNIVEANKFQLILIDKIKQSYVFLENVNKSSSLFNENLNYIHMLCIRVLNECVYLLNEVGVWCLAKSLLPFICQLDKISLYIENTGKNNAQQQMPHFSHETKYQNYDVAQNIEIQILDDSNLQQQLVLQYTSTCLKDLREMCIKEFVQSKTSNQIQQGAFNPMDAFVNKFSTPKVKSLVDLLRKCQHASDEFCCLIFVQNKQVATSLSLLLKKLAKEDHTLNYLYPNYVIGSANNCTSSSNSTTRSNQSYSSSMHRNDDLSSAENSNSNNDGFKQEEILRKFYSGEINLLICTYEMEEHITSPSCVNLIIRFNCNVNIDSSNNSNDHLPFDYFSYIGTKSRARSKNASCYFFIEQNYFDSFFRQFAKFKQIESSLIKNYSKLVEINSGFRSLNTNEFASTRLPSDALTQLTPRFEIYTKLNNSTQQKEYKCDIFLPINSSIHEPIQSEWETDLFKAKSGAAYKACFVLFLKNELNEFLEPITKEMFYRYNHKNDGDDDREWSQFSHIFQKHYQSHANSFGFHNENFNQQISNYMSHRPGGNKRKQVYQKKVSPYLHSLQLVSTQQHSYLYVIKSQLNVPLLNTAIEDKKLNSTKNECFFGLITSKPLLEIVDFPIFTTNGEETISFELIKSSFYLTPNQFKVVKGFHKFLFSNVLRMDSGRGAIASQYLTNTSANTTQTKHGYYTCVVFQDSLSNDYDIDWDLMKKVDGSTDRQFLKVPKYIKRIEELEENEELDPQEPIFQFDNNKYTDSVVIPFYRTNETNPQFYCVSSIDYSSTPLSKFPLSSHSSSSQYETFYEYFALKYNILITNIIQPLLYVSHPSTRLNLLTPRYMNMKASVLQKSYSQNRYNTQTKVTCEKKTSSNKIFLVPELVNVHPFSATLWRRCLCLPSILYRLNSLLVAEELRREIAHSTGVGLPWISEQHKFEKLSFIWDANKEIEISDIPDVEIDIAAIQQQNQTHAADSNKIENGVSVDPKWNFEISEWDDTCLKEANVPSTNTFTSKIFETLNLNNSNSNSKNNNGWLIDEEINCSVNNPKTLFIDPNDMDFFGEGYIDTDEETENLTKVQPNKTQKASSLKKPKDFEAYNSNEDDDFDDENDDDLYEEKFSEMAPSNEKPLGQEELKLKFTIDMNTLKADMKKKSAKLISKLSVNSNNCFLVKSLVKSDVTYGINDFDEQIVEPKNDFSGFNLANELASNLEDFNKNGNLGQLVFNENNNNIAQAKIDRNLIFDSDHFDDDLELNDWFYDIEFKFDSKKKHEHDQIVAKLKQKFSAKEERKQISKEKSKKNSPEKTFTTTNEKLFLPLNKTEIEKKISSYDLNEKRNSITKMHVKKVMTACDQKLSFISLRNTDWSFPYFMDDDTRINFSNQSGPGPALLLQALTLSNAADGFDLERLETVGDSFLKQAITVYLFFAYPDVHEGKLSYLRSKQVSNYNLYKLGKRRGVHELIISTKFEPLDSWLPSHYESITSINNLNMSKTQKNASNSATILLNSLLSKPVSKSVTTETNNNAAQTIMFDKYKEHLVSDKSIADSVEAIIGAYLITSGPQAALQIMSWFGLEVLPRARCAEDGAEVLISIPEVPAPKINDILKLEELIDGYGAFEACIGYKFKQPAYLLQAFTHASYTYNTVTDCYQRLEFLGDAILDYVITRHLYEDKQRIHSPGELTDLRSALVNNNIFAYLAVKYEFYKYFKYFSPALYTIIDKFVLNQKKRNDEFDLEEDFFDFPLDEDDEDDFLLMTASDGLASDDVIGKNSNEAEFYNQQSFTNIHKSNELEEMEVPKCLGDIFESVAGAIFLDSNKSFDTVWRVYYGLMKPHIDKFTSKVPKSPIRELFELEPETAKFEKPERTIDGKIRVTVSVFGKGKFKGVGRNYRIAKNAAAKLALKFLRNQII